MQNGAPSAEAFRWLQANAAQTPEADVDQVVEASLAVLAADLNCEPGAYLKSRKSSLVPTLSPLEAILLRAAIRPAVDVGR